jgi:RNA polymerase sigma factor (sigma-70 family)
MPHGQAGTLLQHLRKLVHAESSANHSDTQLLERFAAHRDEAAFTALMARRGPLVLNLCQRILHNAHDAEDAFQATFLVLARMAGSIRKGESLGSWLYGVAYRIASKSARAAGRRRDRERQAPVMPRPEEPADVTLRDLQAILDEEVNRLPAKYRGPFVLCCLECKSRDEAATELGWKHGTLASRLAHAKRLLQDRLTRRGVTLSAALGATAITAVEAAALPAPLAATTLQAALQFASKHAAASGPAAVLARGALRALFVAKVKRLALLLAALLLLPTAAGLAARHAAALPEVEQAPPVGPGAAGPAEARVDRYGDALPERAVRRFGTLRLRNGGAVAFGPDGKHIVTSGGASGRDVIFWDRQTGKEARRLSADSTVRQVHFSPDGKVLAAMLSNVFANSAWDVATGKVLFPFKGEHGTFTADGRRLLSVYNGQGGPTVGAWEVETGKQTGEWTMPEKARDTCCSPDGKTVAYALDGSLVLHDLATGAEARRLPDTRAKTGPSSGQEFTFSPDGKRVAATSLRGLRLWKVATGQEEFAWDRLVDSPAYFSADGKQLSWTGYDERSAAHPWVLRIGQDQPRRLGLPINNLPSQLAFSPDGATLAVTTDARTLELREVATGKDALPLDAHAGRVFGLQLSPDGQTLATSDSYHVLIWERGTGKLLRRFPEEAAAAKNDHRFMVWDVRLGADGQLVRGHDPETHGHWRDLGTEVLTRLQKLGIKDGKAPAFAGFQGSIHDVLESRDGRYLAVSLSDTPPNTIGRMARTNRLWNTKTGQPLDHVRVPAGQVLGVFSPDNRLLVTTTLQGTIHLWDLASGQERLSLQGHLACSVRSVLFTPDQRFLFSGGDDSQVLQWDLTGRAIDGVWRTVRHESKQQLDLWARLGSTDAAAAHHAQWELAADPEGTVALLQTRLRRVVRADDKETAALIARLDADSADAREEADAALKRIGEPAIPAMRHALTQRPSLELARRIERLLQGMTPPTLAGDHLRAFRAVEVLERIATPDARHLLSELAKGLPESWLTQAAKESVGRLEAR